MFKNDLFKNPNEGIHSYRIGPLASIDLALTTVVAVIIGKILNKSIIQVFIILFILGQIAHLVFGVKTGFIKLIGGDERFKDILVSGIIGWIIGIVCGWNPVFTSLITIKISLIFSIVVFDKIKKKITEFIMSP